MEQESDHAVANQGERPGGTAPLFLDQTEDRKQLFGDRPLPPFFLSRSGSVTVMGNSTTSCVSQFGRELKQQRC